MKGYPTGLLVIVVITLVSSFALADDPKTVWTCPMHPQVKATAAGHCPTCNMELIEMKVAAPETIGEPISGVIKDETLRKHAPKAGYIDNYSDLVTLLKTWDISETLPVDFRNDIVLVQTVDGPNRIRLNTKYDEATGNLEVVTASTKKAGPGFGWAMQVVTRDGVKQISGKAVEFDDFGEPAVLISAADAGKTRQAEVGQIIAIDLKGNPTTGYGWAVESIDGQAVRQANEIIFHEPNKDVPPAETGEKKIVGAGGIFHATFRAVKEGKATVKMVYSRPWEKDKEPAKTFTVTLDVKPAKATAAVLKISVVDGKATYTLAGKTYTDLEKLLAALKTVKADGAGELLLTAGPNVPKAAIGDAINVGRAADFDDIGMTGEARK